MTSGVGSAAGTRWTALAGVAFCAATAALPFDFEADALRADGFADAFLAGVAAADFFDVVVAGAGAGAYLPFFEAPFFVSVVAFAFFC